MRVALITFCPPGDGKSAEIIKRLGGGAASSDNQVELVNGLEDLVNTRLTVFDYIAVVIRAGSFFSSKVPARVQEFLSTSGNISGKKGCALVVKGGFSSEKTCRNLMKVMESQGVRLDYSDVVRDVEHAQYVAKKIG